jgi:hypothetical protein
MKGLGLGVTAAGTGRHREIIVLDPGELRYFDHQQSISIINDRVGEASIRPITAAATDTIYLRRLIIDGAGTAFRGSYLSALCARVKDDVQSSIVA